MFNKTASGGNRVNRVASLMTADLSLTGNIKGDGDLQLDCAITGDVEVTRLTLGETGKVEGAVRADTVEIRGAVIGSITARHIHLHATARMDGDLLHDDLTIDSGAQFQGRSLKRNPAPETHVPASLPSPDTIMKPDAL